MNIQLSQTPVNCDTLCVDRGSAINILNGYTEWEIGKFFTILYVQSAYPGDQDYVKVIVAVGIKNASECGIMGTPDSNDIWRNKYYPNQVAGPEFYRIIKDTGTTDPTPPAPTPGYDLHETTFKITGTEVTVSNERQDEVVEDPFEFLEIGNVGPNPNILVP